MTPSEMVLTITKELILSIITSSGVKPSLIDTEEIEKLGDNFKKLSKKVEEAYNELKFTR